MALVVPILTYHKISPVDKQSIYPGTYVPPKQFSTHLRILNRQGYGAVSVEKAFLASSGKPIVLTFDDGFLDYYTEAAPRLESAGMRGQVYLVSAKIGAQNDWDIKVGDVPADLMNRDQILELLSRGHHFGSHTQTHADLSAIPTEATRAEIAESKTNLESWMPIKIRSFCYPYGRMGADSAELVRAAGYEFGLSTKKGINDASTGRFILKRIAIRHDTIAPVFLYKLFRAVRLGR